MKSDDTPLDALLPYLPTDRRHALAGGEALSDRAVGSALFVDISGFTPLAEALARSLGPQRGAEELTQHLNRVYDALIAEVDRYRGSVIGFSGDALTCWFGGDAGLLATASALNMQRAMQQFGRAVVPGGEGFPLTVKSGIASGAARRFLVGDPARQLIDVLAGRLLDEMAEAEHQAAAGEVVLGPSARRAVEDRVQFSSASQAPGQPFGVASRLKVEPKPDPWSDLPGDSLSAEQLRPWLLGPVYERLRAGQGDFLAELRPAVAVFLRFSGIDYDADPSAGEKLAEFVGRVQRALGEYEGTLVDLTTGDKGSVLYLAFGAPLAHEDDGERAAAAALELRTAAAGLPYLGPVQIGINRGRMRTGAYGGRTRRTYGVLGDATNLAARLMMAAEPGEILMTRETQREFESAFRWGDRRAIRAKGKAEPVQVVTLLATAERELRARTTPRGDLPMVGRDEELRLLEQAIERTIAGQGQYVAITAEAGMGKSRLLAEAVRVARGRDLAVFQGECKSYGMQSSYLVWSTIWRTLLGLNGSLPESAVLTALERRVDELDPALRPRLPLLGPLLDLSIPDTTFTRPLDPELRKRSLERMLGELLGALAREQGLAIVLEDVHWIDPLSKDLLDALLPALAGISVLLLVTYRPEGEATRFRPAALPHASELRLRKLALDQAEQWIALKLSQLYGSGLRAPRPFVERLLGRADGNPFYIEEVLNYLKDHAISPRDTRALSEVELPPSLHSLVLTRIDRLGERPRSALRVASVLGRSFRVAHLLGAHPELDGQERLGPELAELERKGFVEVEAGDAFSFKHSVIQEVAYESLPFALRKSLHGRVAEYLEGSSPGRPEALVDLLAYHYFRGESWPKALDFSLESARQAQREYANELAISAASNALQAAEQLDGDPAVMAKVLACQEILGAVLDGQARYPESVEAFGQMRRTAEDLQDPIAQARAWHGIAEAQMHQGELREAISSAEQEEAVAQQAESRVALAKALWMQAWGAFRLGEIDRAMELGQRLAGLGDMQEDRVQQAENLNLMGVLHWASSRYAESEAFFEQALAAFQAIGDDRRGMPLLNNLGVLAESRGDFAASQQKYEAALRIARQIGNRDGELVYLGNLAGVKVRQDDFRGAEADLLTVLELTDPEGVDVLADTYGLLAEASLGLGRPTEALRYARQALDSAVKTEAQDDLAAVWRVLGMVAAQLEQPPVLERTPLGPNRACEPGVYLKESARIFREIGREDELARTLRAWARVEADRGDREGAATKWKEAKGLFHKLGATHEVERMADWPQDPERQE